jgi:hypothetical protein
MRKGSVHLKTGAMLLAMVMVFVFTAGAVNTDLTVEGPVERGADLIVIDVMRAMKPLERPPVIFFHSRHTDALTSVKRDCTACHMTDDNGRLSLKFKRLADADAQTVSDTYHLNCIACHRDMKAQNRKSGPLTCGECHRQSPDVKSTWQPIVFDKSLHYRHVKANQEKCANCHHEFNPQLRKLEYVKGKESACSYCHKETPVDDTSAIKDAAHRQCIGCHRSRIANTKQAGPIGCVGCHDADHQMGIEVLADVPRMQRNQPDAVLVKTGPPPVPGDPSPPVMNPVPFDHLAHETYNDSCKVCHHADLASCSSCHTTTGKPEGDGIKLAQAMHSPMGSTSCIGCHQAQQQKPACAGCHTFMGTTTQLETTRCLTCHMTPLAVQPETAGADPAVPQNSAAAATGTDASMQMAQALMQRRNLQTKVFPADRVPETVSIGDMSDRFEPATFPHGKVLKALVDQIRDNRLAGYFHTEPGTLCQGCHHNSPAAEKPPLCSSCHGSNTVRETDGFRPGLSGAFHQQCIGCHTSMGITKPASRDCNACHVEKKKG